MNRLISTLLGIGILVVGVGGFALMTGSRDSTAEAAPTPTERSLRVETMLAVARDVQVMIRGYGEARPLREIDISPEVSGRVVGVMDDLVVGRLVREGEELFAIEPRMYAAELEEAAALDGQWEQAVRRLQIEFANDGARLKTLERTMTLASDQLDRAREMKRKHIGNQFDVDGAEQSYNTAVDYVDQLKRQLDVYPIRIAEARQNRAAAEAKTRMARLNVERTRVLAPFDGRVTALSIELGQYAQPGTLALSLADDSILEIPVTIDAKDARLWLQFDGEHRRAPGAWFSGLQNVSCRVSWTEDPKRHAWNGRVHRVESFDANSRTLTLTVRVDAPGSGCLQGGKLPLVAGMFCEALVPGRTLRGVIPVPQRAVTIDGTVGLVVDGRLKTREVHVARYEGDMAYIDKGIELGDEVVTTRLVGALENTRLEIDESEPEG